MNWRVAKVLSPFSLHLTMVCVDSSDSPSDRSQSVAASIPAMNENAVLLFAWRLCHQSNEAIPAMEANPRLDRAATIYSVKQS
jgi:hypothetical protein